MVDNLYSNTKLEDYIDYREEVIAERNIFLARCSSEISSDKKNKLSSNLKKTIDQIFEKYSDKFHEKDIYFFQDLNKLEKFLLDLNCFNQSNISECINHEQSHINKANELGYEINRFSCILLIDQNNNLTYAAGAHLNVPSGISYDDFKLISLAPENPSYSDKLI